MTSYAASEEFFGKIDAQDKEFKPFEVRCSHWWRFTYSSSIILVQDGYHELVHEPDGVKEKFVDECITWILAHAKRI